MRLLVLTKSILGYLQKNKAMRLRILEYIHENGYDKILLCSRRNCGLDLEFENIAVEKTTPGKLFKSLKNIAKAYKNLRTVTITHNDEQSVIENYLRSGEKLNICFVNLSENGNQYENYSYTDIDLDPNFFSVKLRKYNSTPLLLFNVYDLPLMD
jgi:hypothetical protein